MHVQAPPVPPAEPELHLLLEPPDEGRANRTLFAAAGTVLVHVAVYVIAVLLADYMPAPVQRPVNQLDLPRAVHLIVPLDVLTQKEPNKGKVAKELTLENLLSRPEVRQSRETFSNPPAMPAGRPTPPPVLEPPPVTIAQAPQPMPGTLPNLAGPPLAKPPQAPPPEKPKLTFETPGAPSGREGATGRIEVPKFGMQEAVRNAVKEGPAGVTVGDTGADLDTGGIGQLEPRPGQSGRQASTLELQSDPMGVDFKPYLIRVITSVRRNWLAVIPESARFGQRGKVILLFSISKNGAVPKLAIDNASGTQSLDRAAVASISASTPFPPLPTEFRGDVIRLRLVFYYNVASR